MGYPVVHFEITGRDGAALRSFYADLFDWRIAADNPMGYGVVDRDENLSAEGVGIGGGIAQGAGGLPGACHGLRRGARRRGGARQGRRPRGCPDDGPRAGHGGPGDRPVHRPGGPRRRRPAIDRVDRIELTTVQPTGRASDRASAPVSATCRP